MKKIFLCILLVWSGISYSQNGFSGASRKPDSLSVTLVDKDSVYIYVLVPVTDIWMDEESTIYSSELDTLTMGELSNGSSYVPYYGENFWNYTFYVSIMADTLATDTETDSFTVDFSPINPLGCVMTNDIRYMKFSNATSDTTAEWYDWSHCPVESRKGFGASSNAETVTAAAYRFKLKQFAAADSNKFTFLIHFN